MLAVSFPPFSLSVCILDMSRSPSAGDSPRGEIRSNENNRGDDSTRGVPRGNALVEAEQHQAGAVQVRYDDPESLLNDLLAQALEEQPKVFLQFDRPVVLRPTATRPGTNNFIRRN